MQRYFFDAFDNGSLERDDVGVPLSGVDDVKIEATRGLIELASDILPGAIRRELAIHVRDEAGSAVLRTFLVFEMQILAE